MKCYSPSTIEELLELLREVEPGFRVVAGATDLSIALQSGKANPGALLYIGKIPQTREIARSRGFVHIGAMVTMTELEDSDVIKGEYKALADAAGSVGSVQIRNKATIGGNLCNASPAADLMPPLWLFGASLSVAGKQGVREVPLAELPVSPGKTALNADDVVLRINLPDQNPNIVSGYKKLGSRQEVTISRVGMAALLEKNGAVISRAEIVLGAVAVAPVRVFEAEKALTGKTPDARCVENAAAAVSDFILEINNRSNRYYKSHAVRGLTEDLLGTLI